MPSRDATHHSTALRVSQTVVLRQSQPIMWPLQVARVLSLCAATTLHTCGDKQREVACLHRSCRLTSMLLGKAAHRRQSKRWRMPRPSRCAPSGSCCRCTRCSASMSLHRKVSHVCSACTGTNNACFRGYPSPSQAVVEILSSLPGCGAFEIRLGHRALYEAALAHIAVPPELRGAAAQLLATAAAVSPLNPTARGKRWPSIRCVLQHVFLSYILPAPCWVSLTITHQKPCVDGYSSGLEGLGLDGPAVSRCKALVLQAAGEAAAALHRLRASAGTGGKAAFTPPLACLDDLQVRRPAVLRRMCESP